MVQHHIGYELHEHVEAQKFALKVLIEMDKVVKEFSSKTGRRFALARTPAESAAQRLAVADLIHYPRHAKEVVKGDLESALKMIDETRDLPIYYTNGPHVNISAKVPLEQRILIEQRFFPILSGGNIFHVWLAEANPDPEALMKLNRKLAMETWIGYWAHTKDLTLCLSCGYTVGGLQESCPVCRSKSLKYYSRITGYYQEVDSWNTAKRQELRDRYRVSIK
ncbi:MAG: hypothetical protein DRJ33_07755 [Candidatus Methanomethylicota archaeon]|uniref:Uncharacterized protein n=1 Tax=Thermoproteota archaeon TaxID=2056631 RepID=A0A497ERP1_9CREN|nr:MAG: hypothetical protein DRJ33_07755 [Candidatus Verstraetearchaeota archaeon]